jgi:hypothetical protein
MADLVTHMCTGLIYKAVRSEPHVPIFVLGTVAPDLCSRVPSMALTWIGQRGVAVPPALIHAFEPLHLPVGMLVLAALVAMLFSESSRRAVFMNFLGGMLLHLAVDLLQDHHGVGYVLGFPFLQRPFELGLVSSEASVRWVPGLLLVSLCLVVWRRRGDSEPRESDDGG